MSKLDSFLEKSEYLKACTDSRNAKNLAGLFDDLWAKVRQGSAFAGQPRGSASAVRLTAARTAFQLAKDNGDPWLVAEANRMMAYALNAAEEYAQSLPFYRQAIAILEKLKDSQRAARTRLGFVAALYLLGRYQEALDTAQPAEQWFLQSGDKVGLARLYVNVGNLCHRLDKPAEAYRYHRAAIDLFQELGDRDALAPSFLNLANDLSCLDRFDESDLAYAQAELLSKELGLEELWTQACYNRSYLYYLRGQHARALSGFDVLRKHFRTVGSARHMALCDLDESEIRLYLDMPEEASTLALRAASEFRALEMGYEHAKATAFAGMAEARTGNLERALGFLRTARAGMEAENNQFWMARTGLCEAEVLYSHGQFDHAEQLAISVRANLEKLNVPSLLTTCLLLLGRLALSAGKLGHALDFASRAIRVTEESHLPLMGFPCYVFSGDVCRAHGDTRRSLEFYELASREIGIPRPAHHHDTFRVAHSSGSRGVCEALLRRDLRDRSLTGVSGAFSWIEKAKSVQIVQMLSNQIASVRSHCPESASSAVLRLREELHCHHLRSQQDVKGGSLLSQMAAIQAREKDLQVSLEKLSFEDPEYVALQQVSGLDAAAVQRILPADTTLVEYFIVDDDILAFTVSPNEIRVLDGLCRWTEVRKLHESLHEGQTGPAELAAANELLNALYLKLVSQIEPQLRTTNLIIVPDGPLHFLPFHALYDGQRYLIDRFRVSYSPSAASLSFCLRKADVRSSDGVIAAGSGSENQTVFQQFRCAVRDIRAYSAGQAVNEVLAPSRKAGVAHLAADVDFHKRNPLFTQLDFGAGAVTVLDLFKRGWDADIVSVGGKAVGLQRTGDGNDWTALIHAFLYSGARSVVTSVWDGPGVPAGTFIQDLWLHWRRGHTRSDSFRQAILNLRHQHPHPNSWAPFFLFGKP